MVALSEEYKKRCRWHLFGTGAGISDKDRERLESVMNSIANEVTKDDVEKLIDQCSETFLKIDTSRYIKSQHDDYFSYVERLGRELYRLSPGVLNGCTL